MTEPVHAPPQPSLSAIRPHFSLIAKRWSRTLFLDELVPLPPLSSEHEAQEYFLHLLNVNPEVCYRGEQVPLSRLLDGWAVYPIARHRVTLVGEPARMKTGRA